MKIGRKAWIRMTDLWDYYRKQCDEDFNEVGVYGYKASDQEGRFAPWRWLPYFVGFGWLIIMVFVWCYHDQRPSGSFSTIAVKAADQEVRVIDTATGERK